MKYLQLFDTVLADMGLIPGLSERSVVALRGLKEAIRLFGSCTKIPITKDFILAVKHMGVATYSADPAAAGPII